MTQTLLEQSNTTLTKGDIAQEVMVEARRQQRHAQVLLRSLIGAKAECDRQMAQYKRSDAIEAVTGHSSLDLAIESTRCMIAELDSAIARAE